MEHRYRYRTGLHIHPLPQIQPDVRTYRHTASSSCPLAPEHSIRHHRDIPLQDRTEIAETHHMTKPPASEMTQAVCFKVYVLTDYFTSPSFSIRAFGSGSCPRKLR